MNWRGEAWRFGLIGSVGFAVDAGVLTWLVRVHGWGLYEARALSFALAVTVTFSRRASAGASTGAISWPSPLAP